MTLSEKGNELNHKILISILMVLTAFLSSCKEDKKTKGQQISTLNTYSIDSAFFEIKKKLEQNPNDPDALFHLADLYDRNGQYIEAVEGYKKVIEVKPDMGYAYFKMATAYNRLQMYEDAVTAFINAVKYIPDNPVLYNNLGYAYGKIGRLDDEIKALKKAISIRPRYTSARYNLGLTYLKKGNKKSALEEYEALKQFDAGAAELLYKEINK